MDGAEGGVREKAVATVLAALLFGSLLPSCLSAGPGRRGEGVEVVQRMSASYHAPALSLDWDGGSALRKVVIEYSYDNPVSATPSGSTRRAYDLSLASEAADALWKELNRLWPDFLALADSYGAPEGERYYPYEVQVTNMGVTKRVLHRSNPSYSGPPEAFDRVVDALRRAAGD